VFLINLQSGTHIETIKGKQAYCRFFNQHYQKRNKTMKKMNKVKLTGVLILGLGLLTAPAFAETDYSSMTNEEMAAMRGIMRDASQEERDAFRSEWQSRVNSMSQEERQQAVGRPDNASRDGAGNKYGKGGGQGQGNGSGGGGRGMGRGRR
jgi:uncharacterized membrane protein YgcG